MIIRCPQCEHSRSINESKIPSTAELATCPKCKHRFRFRTLGDAGEPEAPPFAAPNKQSLAREPFAQGRSAPINADPAPTPQGLEVQRPQGAIRETAARRGDIWDAVDSLHHRWQTQMDQHVTEVVTPRPSATPEMPEEEHAPEKSHHEHSAALDKATAAMRARLGGDSGAEAASPPLPAAKVPAHPYSEDGFRPEERVERDMRTGFRRRFAWRVE